MRPASAMAFLMSSNWFWRTSLFFERERISSPILFSFSATEAFCLRPVIKRNSPEKSRRSPPPTISTEKLEVMKTSARMNMPMSASPSPDKFKTSGALSPLSAMLDGNPASFSFMRSSTRDISFVTSFSSEMNPIISLWAFFFFSIRGLSPC